MGIEDDLNEIGVNQQSELEGVAKQLFDDSELNEFTSIDMKTNLIEEEIGLCLINDIVFRELGMADLSPSRQFKRLVSSRKGWKTEKFVETASGVREQKNGLMSNIFGRRE